MIHTSKDMENDFIENPKRGRGRPPKAPGEPKTTYKSRANKNSASTPLSGNHAYIPFLPDKSLSICEECYEAYFNTMFERQLIWKRRFVDKQQAPWTEDEIFANTKFPNVYRELDRSSQFLINDIILANKNSDVQNLTWKVLVYRLFNNPETFKLASFVWKGGIPDYGKFEEEQDKYAEFLGLIQKCGANPFANAYMISSTFSVGKSRTEAYAEDALPVLHDLVNNISDMCLIAEGPEDIIRALKFIPGVSDFLAHELYTDLLYINKFTGKEVVPFKANDFVNVGPGSLLGIRLIYPNLDTRKAQVQGMYKLLSEAKRAIEHAEELRGEKFPFVQYNPETESYEITDKFNFTIRNIEDWLCEYGKYWKMKIEAGRIQRKFKPVSENDAYDKPQEQETEQDVETPNLSSDDEEML